MLELIIVKYNNREYENDTIQQVLQTVNIPYHMTVYENYDKDENLSVVWNRLIKRSNAKYICLLNNDTVPREEWLVKLMEVVKKKDFGAVGPISNHAGGHQGGFTGPQEDKVVDCLMLSGFCMLFPKSVWKKVGGFNEDYHLYGEDSDFCRKITKAGYRMFTHYGAYVYHHGSKSMSIAEERGKDIKQIRKEASQRYQQTWNGN